MKLQLHWQILIAMVVGVIVGVVFQIVYDGEPTGWLFGLITSLGTIFIHPSGTGNGLAGSAPRRSPTTSCPVCSPS
jgi:hypothetical protein